MKRTRAQLLSEALSATIVEDHGYRAVLHNQEHGFMRYHTTHGLQKVSRQGKQWRVIQTILTAEDLDVFLKEVGLLHDGGESSVLEQLHTHIGGEIIEHFSGGGGVISH